MALRKLERKKMKNLSHSNQSVKENTKLRNLGSKEQKQIVIRKKKPVLALKIVRKPLRGQDSAQKINPY